MFISDKFKYKIIEKTSTNAFQALWVKFLFEKKSNIICGIIYRQHNSPESFQAYFDEALERFSQSVTSIVVEQGSFQTELRIVGNSNKLVYFHHVDFKNLQH